MTSPLSLRVVLLATLCLCATGVGGGSCAAQSRATTAGTAAADTEARVVSLEPIRHILQTWQPADGSIGIETAAADGDRDTVSATLRGPAGQVRVLVSRRPADGQARGGVLLPSLLWQTDPRQPDPRWQTTLDALLGAVRTADRGTFGHRPPPRPAAVVPPPLLVGETWLLLALSLWSLGRALGRSVARLPGPKRMWFAILAAAWLLRAVAPHRLVMVHFGWLHFDQAVTLAELPRYGPATTLLHHAWLRFAPQTPASIQWLHTVLGTLTLLPMAAWAAQMVRADSPPRARLWAAAVTAGTMMVLPVALLDHGSESMLVPAMLWWWGGVLLLYEGLTDRTHRLADLLAAVVLLALCGLCRPDCLLLALPVALLLAAAADPLVLRRSWRPAAGVAAVLAVLWLPAALFVRDRATEDLLQGNLPRLGPGFWALLPRRLADGWLIVRPAWFAAAVPLLAVGGIALRPLLRTWLLLWLAALLWAIPMLIDFNDSSALRLHMPSAELVVVLAALVVAHLDHRWLRGIAALAIAATAALTWPAVMAPQNSDAVAEVVDAAARLARDGRPTVLVGRGYADEPAFGVHLFWPTALLEPGDQWLSVRDWQAGRSPPGATALGVIDARCWAHFHRDTSPRDDTSLHPACTALVAASEGQPLWQARVANRGERGFGWYAAASRLPYLEQRVVRLRQRAGLDSRAAGPPRAAD